MKPLFTSCEICVKMEVKSVNLVWLFMLNRCVLLVCENIRFVMQLWFNFHVQELGFLVKE